MKLGPFTFAGWPRRAAACVIDGDELAQLPLQVRRWPMSSLGERLRAGNRSVLLLLDHSHGNAAEALRLAQERHVEHFDVGAVVVGVENLPHDDDEIMDSYRRAAQAPVFRVDLRSVRDLLRLDEVLVTTRVAATLRRL